MRNELRTGIVLCCVVLGLSIASPKAARAWIFPEHMELTRLAFERELPLEAREMIEAAVKHAQAHGYGALCSADKDHDSHVPFLVAPLERVPEFEKACLPYSALPALAGDHANTAKDLGQLAKGEQGTDILGVVAERWHSFLDADAPPEMQRLYRSTAWLCTTTAPSPVVNGAPRVFTRSLDIALQATDDGYAGRAGGSRAHFQDSLTSIKSLLHQLESRGNVDNALGQMLAHHIRSLELALHGQDHWAEALFEHAHALHYMQDAFASGHMGTEHRLPINLEKTRRHDFLNRAGLNVQRTVLAGRCEQVAPQSSKLSDEVDPRCPAVAPQCWVAYGDGYLDEFNARVIADAVARVQMQFALALSEGEKSGGFIQQWLSECRDAEAFPKDDAMISQWQGKLDENDEDGIENLPAGITSERLLVGQDVVHRYVIPTLEGFQATGNLQPGTLVRASVESSAFKPYLVIRDGQGNKINANAGVWPLDTSASVIFPLSAASTTLEVGSQNGVFGRYTLRIHAMSNANAQAQDASDSKDCASMVAAARLLDPQPSWTQSQSERERRAGWSDRTRRRLAYYLVKNAKQALHDQSIAKEISIPASGGDPSGAMLGVVPDGLLGAPLNSCDKSGAWFGRAHPLCSSPGDGFRESKPDAALFRPLLAAWPTPMGDITVIEGKDAFDNGLAAQVVFGGGVTQGVLGGWPTLLNGWFGTGISYRANNLFPARENRSVAELNVTVQPTLSGRDQYRYMTAGFFELRIPLVTVALFAFGAKTVSWPVEFGPLGGRWYFQWPNLIPGGEGQSLLGFDVEILNIDLDPSSSPRTREAGHVMDKELRLRVGRFKQRYLLGPSYKNWLWAVTLEFAWGHSTYFGDL